MPAPVAALLLALLAAPPSPSAVTDPNDPVSPPIRLAEPQLPDEEKPPGRSRIRALWAGYDAPRFAVAVDQGGVVLGHMGAMVPIWGSPDRPGTFAALWPQLEIEGAPIPYQYWRGRLAFEVGRAFPVTLLGRRYALEVSGGGMHESDHVTHYETFHIAGVLDLEAVVVNDLFGRLTVRAPVNHWDVVATLTPRLHVLTCTATYADCPSGTAGSVTVGGNLDVVAMGLRPWVLGAGPFVSARAEGHLENEKARSEWRAALRLGLANLYGAQGGWQLAAELRAGHLIGIFRGLDDREARGLLSLAWSR